MADNKPIPESPIAEISKMIEDHLDKLPDKPADFDLAQSRIFRNDFNEFIDCFFETFPLPMQHAALDALKGQWGMLKRAAGMFIH